MSEVLLYGDLRRVLSELEVELQLEPASVATKLLMITPNNIKIY